MSSKITALTALTSTQTDDVLPIVDVHDTTMAASGTTKQITVGNLHALLAPLASPTLTGTPSAPTATALTSTTQLATTAYADAATGVEKARALAAEALLAPLASPGLTGTPTAPTKTALTNSTALATTAYADAAVGVENVRALAAEALALPLAGGTLSGALAMGSHKITGLTNGSGAQDAAAFGQIPLADSTATDIQPLGTRAAGAVGKWADAGHIHPNTVSNGITPATSGFTAFGTGGVTNTINSTSGADITMVAGTFYYSALYVPFNVTLTGFQVIPGSVGATDNWIVALWPIAGGAALANSALAGTVAPAAGTKKAFPFTGTLAVTGPGVYIFGLQSNGTTARFRAFQNAVEGFATGSVAGVFGTVPSLSPATTYTVNLGPFASSY